MDKGNASLKRKHSGHEVTSSLKPKIKKTKISRTSLGYYHDLDPYTLHKTLREAQSDRNRIKETPPSPAVVKSRSPRVPTFYTYMQDKRKSLSVSAKVKFRSVPQGPHVIPHHGLHLALVIAREEKYYDVFNHLIPNPKDYNKLVDDEIGANHVKKAERAEIVKSDYQRLYERMFSLRSEVDKYKYDLVDVKYFHTVNRLLHLHPYGTYGYKANGAGKKALQGKGERNNKPISIDSPPRNSYNNWGAADYYHESLIGTLKSHIGGSYKSLSVLRRSLRVANNSPQKPPDSLRSPLMLNSSRR